MILMTSASPPYQNDKLESDVSERHEESKRDIFSSTHIPISQRTDPAHAWKHIKNILPSLGCRIDHKNLYIFQIKMSGWSSNPVIWPQRKLKLMKWIKSKGSGKGRYMISCVHLQRTCWAFSWGTPPTQAHFSHNQSAFWLDGARITVILERGRSSKQVLGPSLQNKLFFIAAFTV